jgi:hypothetical protein
LRPSRLKVSEVFSKKHTEAVAKRTMVTGCEF